MRCLSLRPRARLPIRRRALKIVHDAPLSAMNPPRVAIRIFFVGAFFWVLAPLVLYRAAPAGNELDRALGTTNPYMKYLPDRDAIRAALVLRTVQNEIIVVTVAGVAWVLAGMVKSKV